MARIRSPNYPAISLPEAIERVRKIHAKEQHLAAPREVIAAHLGYGGLNGASNKAISAISKYGLLEDVNGDKVKVSPLAMSILFPGAPSEKTAAIKEAAFKPAIFSEIAGEWGGQQPSDANLRSWLIRRNFASDALDRVIQSYRDTIGLVAQEGGSYDSGQVVSPASDFTPSPSDPMTPHTPAPPAPPTTGDPFRLAFTPSGGLEGGFRINNADELDALVTALTGMKFILRKKPSDGSDLA